MYENILDRVRDATAWQKMNEDHRDFKSYDGLQS